jgi:CHAT domain-containing protein
VVSHLLDQEKSEEAIRYIELGWRQQYEDYYQGPVISQELDVRQFAKSLHNIQHKTEKRTALLYIVPTARHLELLLLTPDGSSTHQRSIVSREILLETAQSFRRTVSDVSTQPADYLPKAQILYQWMIAPVTSSLRAHHIDTLLFCLGGGLRSLPLAALFNGKQFLVQQYSLSIIPAFNLMDQHIAPLRNKRVLAMGASQFKQLSALPSVPIELSQVTDQRQKGEAWLNQDFTVEHLKARRTVYPFSIIHLATHAKFSSSSVQQSFIQFWDKPLKLNQLKDLELQNPAVNLLVLSACQTALGDLQAEMGFAGLAVKSGSRAALGSLWAVSDSGTLAFMVNFYRQLQTASIKAEALRQTQMSMIKGTLHWPSNNPTTAADINLAHPYYWSAFTLIGNPW